MNDGIFWLFVKEIHLANLLQLLEGLALALTPNPFWDSSGQGNRKKIHACSWVVQRVERGVSYCRGCPGLGGSGLSDLFP
jgi:hypothetical protein